MKLILANWLTPMNFFENNTKVIVLQLCDLVRLLYILVYCVEAMSHLHPLSNCQLLAALAVG